MPTYQYACTECDERLEVVQSFTSDPLTECPRCGGRLRKVFHPVGVVFKGSGFYRTDSRGSSTGTSGGSHSGSGGGSGSGASGSGSGSTGTGGSSGSTGTGGGSSSGAGSASGSGSGSSGG